MTTVWDQKAGLAPDWMPALHDQLGRVRHLIGESAVPTATGAAEAAHALRQTSDALMAALVHYGVGTPLGWRLHQLRSRLDSHLLAASALADADALDAVVSVLRRTLQFIEPELDALPTDAVR